MTQDQNRRRFLKQVGAATAIALGTTPIASACASMLRSSERRLRSVAITFPKSTFSKHKLRSAGYRASKGHSFSLAEGKAFVQKAVGEQDYPMGTLISVEYAE